MTHFLKAKFFSYPVGHSVKHWELYKYRVEVLKKQAVHWLDEFTHYEQVEEQWKHFLASSLVYWPEGQVVEHHVVPAIKKFPTEQL